MYLDTLKQNLPKVQGEIAAAAERSGRDPGEVRIVAVTKKHPIEALEAALELGLRDLGENRVQELEEKAAVLKVREVRWHMVGHLQRRKAPRLIGLTELIHSVDTVRLAERLQRTSDDEDPPVRILVQVNTSGEDAKSGFDRRRAEEAVLEIAELPDLEVRGLMTMAPFVDDESVLRSCFVNLRETLEAVRKHDAAIGPELSMGMTNDLSIAVEEGSTLVRIGTALFGPRPGTEEG